MICFSHLLKADPIFRINNGNNQMIDKHGTCRTVTNASGKDIMVPTGTSGEWAAFIAATVAGITLGSCIDDDPDPFDIPDDLIDDTDPSISAIWTVAGITSPVTVFVSECDSIMRTFYYRINGAGWISLNTGAPPSGCGGGGGTASFALNNGDTLQVQYSCPGCCSTATIRKNNNAGAVLDTVRLCTAF
jgi:hypothetical protein